MKHERHLRSLALSFLVLLVAGCSYMASLDRASLERAGLEPASLEPEPGRDAPADDPITVTDSTDPSGSSADSPEAMHESTPSPATSRAGTSPRRVETATFGLG